MCNRSSSLLQEGGAYHRFNHYAYLDMSWSPFFNLWDADHCLHVSINFETFFMRFHNATTDTYVARSVSVEKTASNTALDEILPCIYNSTAQAILIRSKELTDQLVELISCTIVHEMVN
ncbi:unnamed protein product [Brassica rapa]|uniref:Uncharacterized protein n=2 Tax=Brassica TaxID=3705 RepID=A0A8D9MDK2_BRACM|nr:unnamed protein product [Brassica napus]CAG7905755.1 unnamed protein product [Brassica rapa]